MGKPSNPLDAVADLFKPPKVKEPPKAPKPMEVTQERAVPGVSLRNRRANTISARDSLLSRGLGSGSGGNATLGGHQ